MDKLIKKVLTDKAARNGATMGAFLLSVVVLGSPWQG
jgi:hypothetical protein